MSHRLTTHLQRIYVLSRRRLYPLTVALELDKFNLTCAPAQFVVFHLLHTDRMQLYTVSEKVHLLTFDGTLL